MKNIFPFLTFLLLAVPCQARTIYVNDDGPADFNNIQAAINNANEGDTVEVQPGIYTGIGNRDIDFHGKAITVRSINPEDPCIVVDTIIDCNGTESDPHRGFYFHSDEDASSIVNGFTITNGRANRGSGIHCKNSRPTIKYCNITANSTYGTNPGGGGIYCERSRPKIDRCMITNNTTSGGNAWGGGICCYDCNPTITNCTIAKNSAYKGGGIYCWKASPAISHCTIADNSASSSGGGIESYQHHPTLSHCILWGNTASSGPQIESYHYSEVKVSYCDIQGGRPGVGNIDDNPLFINSYNGDYHLSHNSPCVNSGNPLYSGEPNETDIDGDPRTINWCVDIGSDEVSYNEPFIGASPSSFVFFAYENSSNPEPQVLLISNVGTNNLKWRINENCSWLKAKPGCGNSMGSTVAVNLCVNTLGLSAGVYSCYLDILADRALNSPVRISITLCISTYKEAELVVPLEYETIQEAIDDSNTGDTVTVTPGTYTGEGNYDIDFKGKAITVRSIDPCNPILIALTIIDCQGTEDEPHRGFKFHNGEGPDSILDGFTITNGLAARDYCFEIRPGRITCWRAGGGIFCEDSSPTIRHCVIIGNTAFEGNSRGGGLFGVNCNSKISYCKILNNSSENSGGGIEFRADSLPIIENCIISNNKAFTSNGGGVCCSSIRNLMLINCTIVNNYKSGIYAYSLCGATVNNCILWANRDSQINSGRDPTFDVSYSNIEDGYPGIGNIDLDPLFFNMANHDYHLLVNSPCIDSGDPNYIPEPNETDLDGNPRIDGGKIDMGAYEVIRYEARLRILPRVINRNSRQPRIMAWMRLPEGITKDQVDEDESLILYPGGIKATRQFVYQSRGRCAPCTYIFAFFNKAELMDAIPENGWVELEVVGSLLEPGQYFYGTDTVRTIAPRPRRRRPYRYWRW